MCRVQVKCEGCSVTHDIRGPYKFERSERVCCRVEGEGELGSLAHDRLERVTSERVCSISLTAHTHTRARANTHTRMHAHSTVDQP